MTTVQTLHSEDVCLYLLIFVSFDCSAPTADKLKQI